MSRGNLAMHLSGSRLSLDDLTLFEGAAPPLDLTPDELLVDAIRRPPVESAAICLLCNHPDMLEATPV